MKTVFAIAILASLSLPATLAGKVIFERGGGGTSATEPFVDMALSKMDRVHAPSVDEEPSLEAANEWTLDCYDSFGPDAATPDGDELAKCLGS